MRLLQIGALVVAVMAVAAAPARADGFVTPFYGYNFGGDSSCKTATNCEDKRANFGVSFGTMGAVFGFEEDLGFAKDFFGTIPNVDNSVFTAMSNLLIGVGKGPVQPYVLVGAGLVRVYTSLNPAQFNSENNSLGYDLGAGVNGYFSRHVGVRGDVRFLRTVQDLPIVETLTGGIFANDKLNFWRASVGLALRF